MSRTVCGSPASQVMLGSVCTVIKLSPVALLGTSRIRAWSSRLRRVNQTTPFVKEFAIVSLADLHGAAATRTIVQMWRNELHRNYTTYDFHPDKRVKTTTKTLIKTTK